MWYILGHGESFENRNNVVQGQSVDSHLTFDGIIQSYMTGKKINSTNDEIKKYKFVSSPLARCRHSCKLIMEACGFEPNSDYMVEDLIINSKKGIFENKNKKTINELYKKELTIIFDNKWSFELKDTENLKSITSRIINFYDKYKDEKNLVIVGHRDLNNLLVQYLNTKQDFDKDNIQQNSELNYVNYCYRDGKADLL